MQSKGTVYIGTYTEGRQHFFNPDITPSRGIYRAVYDSKNASFDELELAAEVVNPSWLVWHPTFPILYAVTENPVEGFQGGAVNVFKRNQKTGGLDLLTKIDSFGQAPCHLTVDSHGKHIIVSNYRGNDLGGNFALFPLESNGLPEPGPILFQGSGGGPNLQRQEGPHAHSSWIDPKNGTILMVDLGTDTIYVRNYKEKSQTFSKDSTKDLNVVSGSGCRHAAFSPDADVLYVVGELNCSLNVFARNQDGFFEGPIQKISTVPDDTKPCETLPMASAICIHPSGKFLYISNRGHGSVSVFRCGENGTRLERIQIFSVDTKIPRFCVVDPAGESLIVCGQDKASIEALRIDLATGRLFEVGLPLVIDSPACLLFCR